jgi:hypothetical protein
MRIVCLGAVTALLLNAAPAFATAYCEVLPTRDGFVALRENPSPASRLVRRMKAGETVQLDTTVKPRAGWTKVFYTGPDRTLMLPGWVNRRLIEKECG